MRTRRGATFIVTVAVLAGLVAILAGAAATHRVAVSAAINRMEARRARLAAEAGLQRAIAAFDTVKPGVAMQTDDWYTLGTTGSDEFTIGNDSFRIQIVDSSSKVNLNTANAAQLAKLPLETDQVSALQDWLSATRIARPDGAKDDYYHNLSIPYNTKLRRLDTFDELLMVKGFTPATLYQPQNTNGSNAVTSTNPNQGTTPTLYDLCEVDSVVKNVNGNGQNLININTASAAQMRGRGIPNNIANIIVQQRGRGFANLGRVIAIPQVTTQVARTILDNFSTTAATTSTGKINVNTASIDVLETLPNVSADIAQQIVNMQAQGIQTLGQMLSVPGISKQNMGALADLITVNSNSFIVRVIGKAGSSTYTMEALLRTDGTTKKITRIMIPPFTDMTSRWNWNDPANQIPLGESN